MTRYLFGMVLLLPMPASAADDLPRQIVVGATASIASPPDRATIQYGVRGEGATADEAVTALVATRRAIDAGLTAIGPVEPHVGEVSVLDVRGRDCFVANGGNRPRLSTGDCAITGYVATLSLEIMTGRVKDAGTMVGLIGRLGGTNPRLASFSLSDDDEPKRRALTAALAEARRNAEAIAAGAGVKLGLLLSASDGSYSPIIVSGTRGALVPPPVVGVAAPPPPPPPIPIALTPRPIETQARVTVTYQILP